MGIAANTIACSLGAERLCLHLPEGDQEIELPYQIHPGLVQKAELAGLISEHLSRLMPALPQDQPLLAFIPREWGALVIDLPYTGLDSMPNPAGQVHWELESNAPESARNYYYNYFETPELTRLIAVRKSMYHFLEHLFSNCGLRLVGVGVLGSSGQLGDTSQLITRAESETIDAARVQEKYHDPSRMLKTLVTVLIILALGLGGGWLWKKGMPRFASQDSVVEEELVQAPVDSSVLELSPDSLVTAQLDSVESSDTEVDASASQSMRAELDLAEPVLQSNAPATPLAEANGVASSRDLLLALAKVEDQLGDFLYLQRDGLYVLDGGLGGAGLIAALAIPARVSHVGERGHWIHFDQALPSPTLSSEETSYQLASLTELEDRLDGNPGCVLLQRMRGEELPRGDWFDQQQPARGWRVRILPRTR